MAYSDAISNAIAARGNALAQAAQQQGQVYGNLASNLGQLPFQAMQAGQRRRAIEVETQHRAAQTQTIQDELDFQKEMSAAISGPGTEEEIKQRAELVLRKRPEKWLRYHELLGQQKQREQQQLVAYNATRQNTPGTVAPQGGYALPMPTQGETVPDGGLGNAFEPVTPMAEQMVHPTIQSAYGPLNAQTTAQIEGRKEQTAETTEARQLKNQMALAEFNAKLRPAPRDYLTSQRTRDPRSSTGWRWMQWDQEANAYSTPGNEAPVPAEIMAGLGTPTVLGTQGGNAVVFNPVKGGGGKVTTTPLPEGGPIRPKTAGPGEIGKTSDIEASEQKIVNLKTMYNKDWVGPAQGRWNDWMMAVPGVKVDPKMAKFYAANTALENEVIKFITGAQMSEPESKRILRQVPTFRDKPEVWEAKYDQTLENVRIMKEKMRAAGFAFGEESSTTPPAPTGGRTSGRRMSDKSDAELKKILGIQ